MTPAGREREDLTAQLLDHPDNDGVFAALLIEVGSDRFAHLTRAKLSNGGEHVNTRDLCAELSNVDLARIARRFNHR